MTTALIYHKDFLKHDTGQHPENAGRLEAIMDALRSDSDTWDSLLHLTPEPATDADILRCHSASHLDRVREATAHGLRLDADTVVVRESLEASLRAAGAAIAAVKAVSEKRTRNAFVAVRPPGHHATPERAMGFCLFNNIAIAARYGQALFGYERIFIIDWDVHHGNGTQDIFYRDPSVYFLSLHQSPWYPGTGRNDERGADQGEGTNLNLPLRAGTPAENYLELFKSSVTEIADQFEPELFLVSAGFDSHAKDPLGSLTLEDEHFVEMTRFVMEVAEQKAGGRVVACLEGGYNLKTLGETVRSHVAALVE